MFDIYKDTCLHPGIIADGIAGQLSPEHSAELSDQLEEKAVKQYEDALTFREKLKATRNDTKAAPGEAERARDWLTSTMTQWAEEILGR